MENENENEKEEETKEAGLDLEMNLPPDVTLKLKDTGSVSKINNVSSEWGIMITIQQHLNTRIGKQKWKKYITASFWNYISTPINFIITLFTALSAGQAGSTTNYLTQNELFYILFISFVLSTINTFFKLKDKAIMNYDAYKKYDKFGAEFERIYFKPVFDDQEVRVRLGEYNILQQKINEYYAEENIENVNYISEVIYYLVKKCLFIRTEQILLHERLWILDGSTKSKEYNKKNIYFDNKSLFMYSLEDGDIEMAR